MTTTNSEVLESASFQIEVYDCAPEITNSPATVSWTEIKGSHGGSYVLLNTGYATTSRPSECGISSYALVDNLGNTPSNSYLSIDASTGVTTLDTTNAFAATQYMIRVTASLAEVDSALLTVTVIDCATVVSFSISQTSYSYA